jgi:DivIVA domain-containing protein
VLSGQPHDYPQRVDRDAIERRDFPVGRRGYDQEAVDAHLRQVADEFETLRGRAPAPSSLAAGASEQVRLILEAAEASAAELRADAGREAGDHVARVKDAAGGMLSRLDELERELGGLLDALRQSGERLNEGLARLQRQASELGDAVAPARDEINWDAAGDLVVPDDVVLAGDLIDADDTAEAGAPDDGSSRSDEAGAQDDGSASDDEAGARLIALNMALSGTPREETARYLAEHFALADADALLDDVYDRADR